MIFAPFAYRTVAVAGVSIDPIVTTWANAAGITDTGLISAVNTFVGTCKSNGTWTKLKAVYPFVTDSSTSSGAKTQFKYNLVDPTLYSGSYVTNTGTGSKSGWKNDTTDTFVCGITANNLTNGSTDFIMGMYTNTDASTVDANDMGPYDGGNEYFWFSAGKNKSGANANIIASTSNNVQIYNQTNSGPFTGLFGGAVSGTTGYYYRRTTQLASKAGVSGNRANSLKIGIGSLLGNNVTPYGATAKTYQFGFVGNYLNSTDFGNLATAVNTLQGDVDTLYSTSRKAY